MCSGGANEIGDGMYRSWYKFILKGRAAIG